ncbi:hypothetical protein SAMD00019534_045130 [Acytostelium subglobosum LB1]|uniref:hypothetical protein n=1 Tax=Acytostelium subglobosum LB1 TaxID=1410327 RepID=UPI000644AB20|nr:hypothetical protein SAMD00019534_045130 [Acytostelium subglobosum LB1]GAM21338.1 hypothetical protein SAMD00019534_045130 [Acytostelium subglobosum LB1]|eukprot:XP_012755457.1 hypothetical protein SAMD00019534_045130 [Acytostelium subglobosum LB1]
MSDEDDDIMEVQQQQQGPQLQQQQHNQLPVFPPQQHPQQPQQQQQLNQHLQNLQHFHQQQQHQNVVDRKRKEEEMDDGEQDEPEFVESDDEDYIEDVEYINNNNNNQELGAGGRAMMMEGHPIQMMQRHHHLHRQEVQQRKQQKQHLGHQRHQPDIFDEEAMDRKGAPKAQNRAARRATRGHPLMVPQRRGGRDGAHFPLDAPDDGPGYLDLPHERPERGFPNKKILMAEWSEIRNIVLVQPQAQEQPGVPAQIRGPPVDLAQLLYSQNNNNNNNIIDLTDDVGNNNNNQYLGGNNNYNGNIKFSTSFSVIDTKQQNHYRFNINLINSGDCLVKVQDNNNNNMVEAFCKSCMDCSINNIDGVVILPTDQHQDNLERLLASIPHIDRFFECGVRLAVVITQQGESREVWENRCRAMKEQVSAAKDNNQSKIRNVEFLFLAAGVERMPAQVATNVQEFLCQPKDSRSLQAFLAPWGLPVVGAQQQQPHHQDNQQPQQQPQPQQPQPQPQQRQQPRQHRQQQRQPRDAEMGVDNDEVNDNNNNNNNNNNNMVGGPERGGMHRDMDAAPIRDVVAPDVQQQQEITVQIVTFSLPNKPLYQEGLLYGSFNFAQETISWHLAKKDRVIKYAFNDMKSVEVFKGHRGVELVFVLQPSPPEHEAFMTTMTTITKHSVHIMDDDWKVFTNKLKDTPFNVMLEELQRNLAAKGKFHTKVIWDRSQHTFLPTMDFVPMVKSFIERTEFDDKLKNFFIQNLINNYNSRENDESMAYLTSDDLHQKLSNNKTFPLFAFYILMRIDNMLNDGIKHKDTIFQTMFMELLNVGGMMMLHSDLNEVYIRFLDRNYDDLKISVGMLTYFGISYFDFEAADQGPEDDRFLHKIIAFADKNNTLDTDNTFTVYKRLRSKKLFLETLTIHSGIMDKEIQDNQSFKRIYKLLTKFVKVTPLIYKDFGKIVMSLEPNEDISPEMIIHRFMLAYELSLFDNTPRISYGKLFFLGLCVERNSFIKEFYAPKKKAVTANIQLYIENEIKRNRDLRQIFSMLNDPHVSWMYSDNILKSLAELDLPPPVKVEIFSCDPHSRVISQLQSYMLQRFRMEDYALISLNCPSQNITLRDPQNMRTSYHVLSVVSEYEVIFRQHNPNVVLNVDTHKRYHDLCKIIVERYIQLKDKPVTSLFDTYPQRIPATLPFILLFTHYLEYLVSMPRYQIYSVFGKLASLRTEIKIWRRDSDQYAERATRFKDMIYARCQVLIKQWKEEHTDEYDTLNGILINAYQVSNLPTSKELNIKYNREMMELNSLRKLGDWLSKQFSFGIEGLHVDTNEEQPSTQNQRLHNLFLTLTSETGFKLRSPDTVHFLKYFLSTEHNVFFKIIVDYYLHKLNTKDIDKIANSAESFMNQLIKQDDSIPLNEIFRRVIAAKDINYTKELQNVFLYFNPDGKVDDKDNRLNNFITKATSLYGIESNINFLFNFIENNLNYVSVTQFNEVKTNINKQLALVSKPDMTIRKSQQIFTAITELIGGLNYHQLAYFKYINPELIEFFASFKDIVTTNQIITSNLISDEYNSSLMNNTIHSHTLLYPFIRRYQDAKEANFVLDHLNYPSLTAMCASLTNLIPTDHHDLETAFKKLNYVVENMSHVRGLYSSAGGTYNSESILPTVVNILKGSEYTSKSSKSEDGLVGWNVKIVSTSVEFTQEKIEDFVQGLKISSTSNNVAKDDQHQTVEVFGIIVKLLRRIHHLHGELDRVYHPNHFSGSLQLQFSNDTLDLLRNTVKRLEDDLSGWIDSINKLPRRLWLLKAHGMSSLISDYENIVAKHADVKHIPPTALIEFVYPYVAYVFGNCGITRATLESLILQDHPVTSKVPYTQFLTELVSIIEEHEDFDEPRSTDIGPMLVHLDTKSSLYNVIMQLNNFIAPHPHQLFYAHTFAKDIEYFFKVVEHMRGYIFFLIGIPREKDRLIQWLSEHYSNQTIKNLARVYIVSTETSLSSDLCAFLPQYSQNFVKEWRGFKETWTKTKASCGIESLNLVCGDSGTGKSYFIKSKKTDNVPFITVPIHPSFDSRALINHLTNHMNQTGIDVNNNNNNAPVAAAPKSPVFIGGKKKLVVHFSVSPYCDFDSFNQFIYPLITAGFVIGSRVGEIIYIADKLLLEIYVECGSPLLDGRKYDNVMEYARETTPLVVNLADLADHTKVQWLMTAVERKCFSYVNSNPYQKPAIDLAKKVTMQDYLQYITTKVLVPLGYHTKFLVRPNNLLQRRCFMKLLNERLLFLDAYFDTYAEIGLQDMVDDEKHTDFQKDYMQPAELYKYFVLEAVKFSDPAYSSAETIWNDPPMITSRLKHNPKTVAVEYLEFAPKPQLTGRVKSTTLKDALENPGKFRTIIANIFGIHSRTEIIINLCHQYNYVLTPDFGIRLLMLHNKVKNQRSLVLTGDTGVGKTFILLFYSLLINAKNNALPDILAKIREEINTIIKNKPDFTLKGDFQDNKLTADSSTIQILEALTQLVDSEVNQAGQTAIFNRFETLLSQMLRSFPLIEFPNTGVLQQIRRRISPLMSTVINRKDRLLEAVKEISNATFKNIFHRIIMHQKFSAKAFKLLVQGYMKEARQLRQDQHLKMVIFIDEFNTSPDETLSIINEIFVDGTLEGEEIPESIFWIGAMNPPKKITDPSSVDYTGQLTSTSNLAFVVQPPPPSMVNLFLNYGEFTVENEKSFLTTLFGMRTDICKEHSSEVLRDFIIIGQNALRQANQSRTHVSIRDINRVIDLYQFFTQTPVGQSILTCANPTLMSKEDQSAGFGHWLAIVCSIAFTYYIRVPPGVVRVKLLELLNKFYVSKAAPMVVQRYPNFERLFNHIYTQFCDKRHTILPEGIALTESLKLNIFCTAISINCRIPLCIVGPPGCSKTLSFTIVMNNMNANKLVDRINNSYVSPWSLMTNADPFRYQCTPHTTDIEIHSVFERSLNRQKTYDMSGGKNRCVVFFDEAGLVNENDSPMKIMHDYLDKVSQKIEQNSVDISVIILSNKVLDAAKTNRMLLLLHPSTITDDDQRALVTGCLFNNATLSSVENDMSTALCRAFLKANTYAKSTKTDLFHQRDFVYFLRHLARGINRNNGVFNGEVLLNSLERNFGGVPPAQFKQLATEFFTELSHIEHLNMKTALESGLLEHNNTITRIKESLSETLDPKQDPNIVPFRYMMLIDPSENESSLMILNELGINVSVIRVGGFENDSTTEALVNVVSQIKNVMASGGTVVLVNTQLIDACFYDVFNRYFTLLPSADGSIHFIANVSFGTHSIFCPVHPEFKIIVHLPLSQMSSTQLPWLNRFEKYQLSIDTMLDYYVENDEQLRKWTDFVDKMKKSASHFVNEFHNKVTNKSLLSGYSETETIPSLVFSIAKDIKRKGVPVITPQRVSDQQLDKQNPTEDFEFRQLNWKILQVARPESIFKCRSLPRSYIEEYLLRQEHFNILRFLNHLFTKRIVQGSKDISNKWTFFTRTSLTLHRLKDSDHLDKFHKILLNTIFEANPDLMQTNLLRIIQLNSFKTSHKCHKEIEDFKQSSQQICMIIADMSTVNQHQFNFIVERLSQFDDSKLMIIICHYPPEFSLSNNTKLNAIFLNNMEFIYIDSLGVKIDSQKMEQADNHVDVDIRTWLAKAFGLQVHIDPESLEETFKEMFFEHLGQVAMDVGRLNMLTTNMQERQFYLDPAARKQFITKLFEKHPTWYREVIIKFSKKWNEKSLFSRIINNISTLILSGKIVQSFLDSIKNSMSSFFYPMVSQIFKLLTNYGSYGVISQITVENTLLVDLVRLFIASVKVPKISDDIERRFEPVTLYLSIYRQAPKLPLYDSIATVIKSLFEQTLNLNPERGVAHIFKKFTERVNAHPIRQLVAYIDKSSELYNYYQHDYVVRTMRFTDPLWMDFVVTVLKNIFPLSSNSILLFTVSNHFYFNTVHYLKSISTPLMYLDFDINIQGQLSEQLTNENLQDTTKAKTAITMLAFKTLFMIIKNKIDLNDDALMDKISNWCTVVREILNQVTIEQLTKMSTPQVLPFTTFVFVLFKVLMSASIDNKEDTILRVVKLIISSFSIVTMQPNDLVTRFISQFSTLNRTLAKDNLPQLSVTCLMDCIEPFITLSKANIEAFLKVCNNGGIDESMVMPMGWYAQIFKNLLDNSYNHNKDRFNELMLKELQVKADAITNPIFFCFQQEAKGVPSENILKFLDVTPAEYMQHAPKNCNMVNSLYFVCLEILREEDKGSKPPNITDRIGLWNKLKTERDIMSTIKMLALATLFLDVLATMINNDQIAKTKTFFENNKQFAAIINDILLVPANPALKAKIEKHYFQMYVLNKIKSEKLLIELLRSGDFLDLVGMSNCLVVQDLSMKESSLFHFVIDDSTEDGKFYNDIKLALEAKSRPRIDQLVQQSRGNPRALGFFRMSMFLLTYQAYTDDAPMDFIKTLVQPGSTFNAALDNEPFSKYFMKIVNKDFDARVKHLDDILMKNPQKPKELYVNAQLLVNSLAAAIGAADNMYLYHLVRDFKLIAGKFYPACEFYFRDCGMIYRWEQAQEMPVTCMKGNIVYKYLIAATSWAAFTWTVSFGTNEDYRHLTDPSIHFANKLENYQKTKQGLTDYVGARALVAITEIKQTKQMSDLLMEPGHIVTEILYAVWSDSYTRPRPVMKSHFASSREVELYETYLIEMIKRVWDDYPNIKTRRIDAIVSKSKVLHSIIRVRGEYTKHFFSPFYDYEFIHDALTKANSPLLLFFSTNISVICISKYFSHLVQFLHLFFNHFARRLPADYQHQTVPKCIEYLAAGHFETEATILTINTAWKDLKSSWAKILEHLNIMEGGCRERPAYEKVLQEITDEMPLSNLLHNRDLGEGLIINLVNSWMDNTQSKAIKHRDEIKPRLSPLLSKVTEGNTNMNEIDIGNITFSPGENFYLVGSNYTVDDYRRFIYKSIAQFQTFTRDKFVPMFDNIESNLAYQFVSGKIEGGKQLQQYIVDFPFLDKTASKKMTAAISNNNDVEMSDASIKAPLVPSLIPESVRDLLNIREKLDDKFALDLPDGVRIPLENKCNSKLHPEELETLCRFFTSLIARMINHTQQLGEQDNINKSVMEVCAGFGMDTQLPHKINQDLSKVSLFCVKTISQLVVNGYLRFGHLYANTIPEPALQDQSIIEHLETNSARLLEEATKDSSTILNWINHLQEVIQKLSSKESREILKQTQPDSLLIAHITPLLGTITNPPPTTAAPFQSLIRDKTPVAYYPVLMRTMHEILSMLKLQNQDLTKETYVEPYLPQDYVVPQAEQANSQQASMDDTKMVLDDEAVKESDVEPALENDEDEDEEIVDKQGDGMVVGDNDNDIQDQDDTHPGAEDFGEIKTEALVVDQDPSEINLRPLKIVQDHPYIHCFLNWLRYKPEFISTVVDDEDNEYAELAKETHLFLQECQKISAAEIDIGPLYRKFVDVFEDTPSMGDFFMQFLKVISGFDPRNKDLIIGKTQAVCSNCNLPFKKETTESEFIFEDLNKGKEEDISVRLQNIFKLKMKNKRQCARCAGSFPLATALLESPQYIFISIQRFTSPEEKTYNRIKFDNQIDISKSFITDKSITYTIHSIVCHEDEPNNPEGGSYSIHIKNTNEQYIRCTNRNTLVNKDEYQETLETNCVMLVYSKAFVALDNDSFLKWITNLAEIDNIETRSMIAKILNANGIDTFRIAIALHSDLREMLQPHVTPDTIDIFIGQLEMVKNKNPSLCNTVAQTLEDDRFLDWVKTIGINTKSVDTVIDKLSTNDVRTFSAANTIDIKSFVEEIGLTSTCSKFLALSLQDLHINQ